MRYIFKTKTRMKPYNKHKWTIKPDIVDDKVIEANSVKEALEIYCARVNRRTWISISDNAIRHKEKLCVDTDAEFGEKQIGYIITGTMGFAVPDKIYEYSMQCIELCVEIITQIPAYVTTDTIFTD